MTSSTKQIVLVTGARCAIGQELILRLGSLSHLHVVGISRETEQLRHLSTSATIISGNMSDRHECSHVIKDVHSRWGSITYLFNCIGTNVNKLLVRCVDEDYNSVFDTNVKTALQLTQAVLHHGGMLRKGEGSVVHIGSTVAINGNSGQVLYGASKAALSGAVKSLAREYGGKQIRFNVVAPGLIENTTMSNELTLEQREEWIKLCPMHRLAHVSEVVDVITAVGFARFMNGQTIAVDGGMTERENNVM